MAIAYTAFHIFGLGLLGALMSGVLPVLIPSGGLGWVIVKREAQSDYDFHANIRADREAEKQDKIDAMLRSTSNIPKVKR